MSPHSAVPAHRPGGEGVAWKTTELSGEVLFGIT